ncbi:MAG: hypothetical protein ACOC9Y_10095 [Chloroflexota bacterium]
MKRIWLTLVAAGMLAIAAFAPVSAQDTVTLEFDEVEGSGVAGDIRIESENGESTVTILLTQGLQDASVHPVHIHEGTCDDLGDVAYPLNNIEDGSSETTIEVDLADLRTGAFAINAHESEENISNFIACADIPAAVGGDVEGDDGDEGDENGSEDDGASDDEDATEDDGASEDDGSGDEESTDEGEDDAADENDDGAAEDDESTEEGSDDSEDSADDASDDESADDSEEQADEEDEEMDDGEEEEQDEVAPATGSTGGIGPDTAAMTLMLLAGGGLVGGMLLRRRASQVQRS